MKISRSHIAAGGTVVLLGALAAVALGAPSDQGAMTSTTSTQPPAEVRTVVVRRTVRVVRHERPRRPKQVAARPMVAVASTPSPAVQVAQAPPATPVKPLRTKTSGGGYSDEREHDERERAEREHGDGEGADD